MGTNVDYYKPKPGYTLCSALKSTNGFLWSATEHGTYVAPSTYSAHSGGSATDWPSDGRRYLPFWSVSGGTISAGTNGCCHYTKSDVADWGRRFKIYIL